MKKLRVVILVLLTLIICFTFSSCSDEENNIILKELTSTNKDFIASVSDYSLSAIAPSGQKVYISNADGTQKEEVFFAYGYTCDIEWADEFTLKITAYKDYNRNIYSIKTMMEECGEINIIYDKIVSENFKTDEPWEPNN